MELTEFVRRIELMPEAVKMLEKMDVSEEEYNRVHRIFDCDKEAFYQEILSGENASMHFLYYFSRFACETYDKYKEKNIPEKIYWDTFQDIRFWCENCYKQYNEYGIHQYDWLFRHVELKLFRFGRLQYEIMGAEHESTWENGHLNVGDPVINVHIPQGEPLDIEKCRESLKVALNIWNDGRPFICHSWLLYPELTQLLSEKSNIRKFQKLFHVIETDFAEREAEERIFMKVQERPEDYPENTSLQRRAKEYLLSGKRLGNGFGILIAEVLAIIT